MEIREVYEKYKHSECQVIGERTSPSKECINLEARVDRLETGDTGVAD